MSEAAKRFLTASAVIYKESVAVRDQYLSIPLVAYFNQHLFFLKWNNLNKQLGIQRQRDPRKTRWRKKRGRKRGIFCISPRGFVRRPLLSHGSLWFFLCKISNSFPPLSILFPLLLSISLPYLSLNLDQSQPTRQGQKSVQKDTCTSAPTSSEKPSRLHNLRSHLPQSQALPATLDLPVMSL